MPRPCGREPLQPSVAGALVIQHGSKSIEKTRQLAKLAVGVFQASAVVRGANALIIKLGPSLVLDDASAP